MCVALCAKQNAHGCYANGIKFKLIVVDSFTLRMCSDRQKRHRKTVGRDQFELYTISVTPMGVMLRTKHHTHTQSFTARVNVFQL